MNAYFNGLLTNEEVIAELLKMADMMALASAEGAQLGWPIEEEAFYDALTKPEAVKDFYQNDELVAITKSSPTCCAETAQSIGRRRKPRAPQCAAWSNAFSKSTITTGEVWRTLSTVISQCEMLDGECSGDNNEGYVAFLAIMKNPLGYYSYSITSYERQ